MIKLMEREHTCMPMEHNITVIGLKMSSMAGDKSNGQMALNTKDSTIRAESMVREN